MKYEYSRELPSKVTGKIIRRPKVEIEIFGPRGTARFMALIDSGADISIVSKQVADLLGIDLTNKPMGITVGIDNVPQPVILCSVVMQVKNLTEKINILAQFMETNAFEVLLGQQDFFDKNRIKFERDHFVFEVTPVKSSRL